MLNKTIPVGFTSKLFKRAIFLFFIISNNLSAEGIASGTFIKTPSGNRVIESLSIGDTVLSFDDSFQVCTAIISSIKKINIDKIISVYFEKKHVKVTKGQKFFSKNHGYVAVESLTKHDEVLSLSSYKFEKIIKICRLNISTDFYLITVEPYHNFFISEIGILTHNSDTFLFGIGGASVPLAASGTIGWIVLIPAAATLALWYHLGCKHEAELKAKLKAEEESKKRRFASDLFEASIEASERENKRREIEKEAERAKAAKNNFDPENIVSTKLDFIIDGYGRKKAQFFITNKAGGIKVAELDFFTPPDNIDFCEADFSELQNFLFKKNKPSIKGSNDGNKNGPGGGGPNGPKDHKYNWWIKLQEDLDKKSNQLLSLKNNFLQKVFPVKQDNLYLLIGTLFVYYSVVTNAFSIACKCAEIAGLKAPTVTAEDAAKSAIKRDAELVDIAKDQLEVAKEQAKEQQEHNAAMLKIKKDIAESIKESAIKRDAELVGIAKDQLEVAKEQAKEQQEHNAAMLEIARDKTAQEQFSKINTLVDKVVSSKFKNPELIEECNQAFEEILSNNDNPLLPMNDAQKKSLSSLSAEIRNSFFSQR